MLFQFRKPSPPNLLVVFGFSVRKISSCPESTGLKVSLLFCGALWWFWSHNVGEPRLNLIKNAARIPKLLPKNKWFPWSFWWNLFEFFCNGDLPMTFARPRFARRTSVEPRFARWSLASLGGASLCSARGRPRFARRSLAASLGGASLGWRPLKTVPLKFHVYYKKTKFYGMNIKFLYLTPNFSCYSAFSYWFEYHFFLVLLGSTTKVLGMYQKVIKRKLFLMETVPNVYGWPLIH